MCPEWELNLHPFGCVAQSSHQLGHSTRASSCILSNHSNLRRSHILYLGEFIQIWTYLGRLWRRPVTILLFMRSMTTFWLETDGSIVFKILLSHKEGNRHTWGLQIWKQDEGWHKGEHFLGGQKVLLFLHKMSLVVLSFLLLHLK